MWHNWWPPPRRLAKRDSTCLIDGGAVRAGARACRRRNGTGAHPSRAHVHHGRLRLSRCGWRRRIRHSGRCSPCNMWLLSCALLSCMQCAAHPRLSASMLFTGSRAGDSTIPAVSAGKVRRMALAFFWHDVSMHLRKSAVHSPTTPRSGQTHAIHCQRSSVNAASTRSHCMRV